MKTKTMIICGIASLMLSSVWMSAQPQPGERPAPPKMKTPEEIAKKEADMMQAEISLSEKQYKKVYNLVKKDHKYRQTQAAAQFGGGMPPQGGGPGMGMGGPGMGGPGMGMGGPRGSMGGGMPPQGAMGQGQRPEGFTGMAPDKEIVTVEYLEKQEAKLKKILTPEQYSQWRSKHPAERLELPPMTQPED